MITLILNPKTEAQPYEFDKDVITIGGKSSQADLTISDETIKGEHLRITHEKGRYVVKNVANDPFTSLNNLPFGKKTLENQDILQVGKTFILCDIVKESHLEEEKEEQSIDVEDLDMIDIDALVREVEELEIETSISNPVFDEILEEEKLQVEESPPLPQPQEKTLKPPEKPAPKEYYIDDFDDESESWNVEEKKEEYEVHSPLPFGSWKMFTGLLAAAILLSMVICSGVYFRESGKSSQEEKKIAAGVSDIALALTYAQMNHITPQKQNWADPDFISNNLSTALSPKLHTQARVNSQGQFNKYPYILRTYTSSDMTRFLVIAQPAPNLLKWLVHRKAIVIDSTAMELRKIGDLKALNRLLANISPLEGKNGEDISQTVKEGSLMTLPSLAGHKNNWGFSPPKALALVRPGAERLIYNAPRYYPFGENVLRKALELTETPGNSQDVTRLLEEIKSIGEFSNIVLYSSQGLEAAIQAKKAISTFSPQSDVLVAYVKFNPQGYVASSHLLMDEERTEIAYHEREKRTRIQSVNLDRQNQEEEEEELDEKPLFAHKINPNVDPNHPLLLKLQALTSERVRSLKSLSDEMITLLDRQTHEIIPDFKERFHSLLDRYEEEDSLKRTKMVENLASLYHEYSEMPLEQFLAFIEVAELTAFVKETLKFHHQKEETLTLGPKQVETLLEQIKTISSFEELETLVQEAAEMLSIEKWAGFVEV